MKEKITENKALVLLLLTGAVYFFLKYITPLIGPVLLAMIFVTIFGPLLQKLQAKLHLHRQIGAVFLLILATAVVVGLISILFSWIVGSMPKWSFWWATTGQQLQLYLRELCQKVGELVGVDGRYLEERILGGAEDKLRALGSEAASGVLSQSIAYARILGEVGGFVVVFLIASVLLAKDYDDIMNRLLDREEYHVFLEVICGVIRYIATYVKAQLIIMAMIGLLCAVVLGVLRISGGVLWGILAGVLDAMPFIGTGVVLVPMAILHGLQGSYVPAIGCVCLYVICIFIREFMEPKLIGRRMGIPPIAVLVSLYAGIQLFGLSGIVKGPLGFVLISEIYRSLDHAKARKRTAT